MKALATALVLILPSVALAWGGEGHQIVALIAEERLTPAAKEGIHELLGADADISDAEIANWADQIRRERRNTAPWHYVDIPTSQPTYDAKRDGHNGDNVIDAIEKYEKILADKTKSKEERAEALKFVVHLIGDVHQPCHTTERDGDRGARRWLRTRWARAFLLFFFSLGRVGRVKEKIEGKRKGKRYGGGGGGDGRGRLRSDPAHPAHRLRRCHGWFLPVPRRRILLALVGLSEAAEGDGRVLAFCGVAGVSSCGRRRVNKPR